MHRAHTRALVSCEGEVLGCSEGGGCYVDLGPHHKPGSRGEQAWVGSTGPGEYSGQREERGQRPVA